MICNKRLVYLFILCTLFCGSYSVACAQYFDLEAYTKHVTIPFKLVRDLIVIKLKINDIGPFNFILDTGVGVMLITDPSLVDSIKIVNKHTINIGGLGKGADFEAYVTSALNVGIDGLTCSGISATILKTDHFGLSNYAGIPIHGLLGYEFFNSFVVKVDFNDSSLVVSKPKYTRFFRNGIKLPITIEEKKPYLNAKVTFQNGTKTTTKLIFDLGAGHPLSIENNIKYQNASQGFIVANLGLGLTGPINGFLGRVKEIEIGSYKLKNVITSFPEKSSNLEHEVKRDGNLGMGILKRFTLLIDYPDKQIYLKKNFNYLIPFEHDMSGLEYYTIGENFNRVIISRVESGSAGDLIGLKKDDELISINFKPVKNMQLIDIDNLFRSQDNKSFLLEIYRGKKIFRVILTLKRRI